MTSEVILQNFDYAEYLNGKRGWVTSWDEMI